MDLFFSLYLLVLAVLFHPCTNCVTAYTDCVTAYTDCATAYTDCVTAYTDCVTAYTDCVTAYTDCDTAYTDCVTAYTDCVTAYTDCVTAYIQQLINTTQKFAQIILVKFNLTCINEFKTIKLGKLNSLRIIFITNLL